MSSKLVRLKHVFFFILLASCHPIFWVRILSLKALFRAQPVPFKRSWRLTPGHLSSNQSFEQKHMHFLFALGDCCIYLSKLSAFVSVCSSFTRIQWIKSNTYPARVELTWFKDQIHLLPNPIQNPLSEHWPKSQCWGLLGVSPARMLQFLKVPT